MANQTEGTPITQISSSACRTHSATLRYSLPVFSLGCCGALRSIQGKESNPHPQDQTPSTSDSARKFPGFDAYRRTISTATLEARSWFDPDWQMVSSFTRVESVRWFEQAALVTKAIPLLEEAYMASKREPSIAWVAPQLLDAYTKAADPAKPESIARVTTLIREMLAAARGSLTKDSPELAGHLASLCLTLLTLKAWDEAEPLLREALTIREAKEPDDWRTFNTQSILGGALLGQKKYAEAEPLLLAGYEGMKKREAAIPDQGKVRLPEALERLVQLYTDWHAADPDKGYDAKIAEWQKKLDEYNAVLATPKPANSAEQ